MERKSPVFLADAPGDQILVTQGIRERFNCLNSFQASAATSSQVEFAYPTGLSVKGFMVGIVRDVAALRNFDGLLFR